MGTKLSWAEGIVRAGARCDEGILRYPVAGEDRNIAYYRAVGGSRIVERSAVPFSMTSLDTPTLRAFLEAVAPSNLDAPIVDVGGGDGRNAIPWLERGHRRVIVLDAAGDALVRLRDRVAAREPAWLDRLLLVEADARDLPLADGSAAVVLAIESLYYLNDDYERGLAECARVLAPGGRLLISERDREGALLMQLLYYGVAPMLASYEAGEVRDGPERSVRTRAFSEPELLDLLAAHGFAPELVAGTSLLALVLGWLNGRDLLDAEPGAAAAVRAMLVELGRSGTMRRCHVVAAVRAAV